MKAISLWQPWATFVSLEWKTIETRTHERFRGLVGQRIAIHAAKKIDTSGNWRNFLSWENFQNDATDYLNIKKVSGTILCTATVATARWAPKYVNFPEREDWNKKALCHVAGKFCLFLEDINPIMTRIEVRGRQGIFEVPDL